MTPQDKPKSTREAFLDSLDEQLSELIEKRASVPFERAQPPRFVLKGAPSIARRVTRDHAELDVQQVYFELNVSAMAILLELSDKNRALEAMIESKAAEALEAEKSETLSKCLLVLLETEASLRETIAAQTKEIAELKGAGNPAIAVDTQEAKQGNLLTGIIDTAAFHSLRTKLKEARREILELKCARDEVWGG